MGIVLRSFLRLLATKKLYFLVVLYISTNDNTSNDLTFKIFMCKFRLRIMLFEESINQIGIMNKRESTKLKKEAT
jgi:hypothetical protein